MKYDCGKTPEQKCLHCNYVAKYKWNITQHMYFIHSNEFVVIEDSKSSNKNENKKKIKKI